MDRRAGREDKAQAWLDVEVGGEGMLKVPPGFWLGVAGDATHGHERVQEEKHLKGGKASTL